MRRDTPEWKLGELAVCTVRHWLHTQGQHLLRVDLIEDGGPPAFVGPDGCAIVPDLLAAVDGAVAWHEVKWKSSCVLHQRTRTWRHGVDLWNWEQYLAVQRVTSIPGFLDIVQLRPGPEAEPAPVLLSASFAHLADHVDVHSGSGDVKAWWDVDVFETAASIEIGDGWEAINIGPRLVRPWEGLSKTGEAPRWRPNNQLHMTAHGASTDEPPSPAPFDLDLSALFDEPPPWDGSGR
jgi:hypothetical protein